MHFIQKHIMRLLSLHTYRRYSELQMPRVESNKFSYHLHKLIGNGYVTKTDRGYKLTAKGLNYGTRVSFEDYTIRIQPKVVTLVVCENKNGEYLMYTRRKQPFLNTIGFPYGKIHLGEAVADAAKRDLIEKTGFTATLTQKGIAYLLVTDKDGEVIEHMLCHIFHGSNPKDSGNTTRKLGEISWMDKKGVLSSSYMPGVPDVFRIATNRKKDLQFEELSFIQE